MGERVKGNGNKKSFLLLPNITFTRSIHILVAFGMYIIFKQTTSVLYSYNHQEPNYWIAYQPFQCYRL